MKRRSAEWAESAAVAVPQESSLEKAWPLVIVCSSYCSVVVVCAPPREDPDVFVTVGTCFTIGYEIWYDG